MIETMKRILEDAKEKHYAVPFFNVIDLQMALGVLEAAEKADRSVLIGLPERFVDRIPIPAFAGMIRPLAEAASIPVGIHFDHGNTEENCRIALNEGFTSVMLDRSAAPYEQNVEDLSRMCEYAHMFGASVEGELGIVAGKEGDVGDEHTGIEIGSSTDPALAAEYVKRTGVDALAIAAGTAHGLYKAAPRIQFDCISACSSATDAALVLHGGTGVPDEDIRKAIRCGITKINVFTELNIAAACRIRDILSVKKGISDALLPERDGVRIQAERAFSVFSI